MSYPEVKLLLNSLVEKESHRIRATQLYRDDLEKVNDQVKTVSESITDVTSQIEALDVPVINESIDTLTNNHNDLTTSVSDLQTSLETRLDTVETDVSGVVNDVIGIDNTLTESGLSYFIRAESTVVVPANTGPQPLGMFLDEDLSAVTSAQVYESDYSSRPNITRRTTEGKFSTWDLPVLWNHSTSNGYLAYVVADIMVYGVGTPNPIFGRNIGTLPAIQFHAHETFEINAVNALTDQIGQGRIVILMPCQNWISFALDCRNTTEKTVKIVFTLKVTVTKGDRLGHP